MKSRPLALPLLWSFYASFLVIGLLMALTGPLLPYLRADLNLGYAEAGLMFSAQSVAHLDGGCRWAFGITALGPAVVAVLAVSLRFPPSAESTVAQKVAVYRKPYLWWGAVALFVYCGVEWGVGAWFPSYWKAIPGTAAFDPAWATSLFWLTFAVGPPVLVPWPTRRGSRCYRGPSWE